MKEKIKKVVNFIYGLSVIWLGVFLIICGLTEFLGIKFLEKITIIPVENPVVLWWIIGGLTIALWWITYFLKKRFEEKD